MKVSRLVISGTSSGVGKTSITCAVIHSLLNKGYTVQPFKVGPDYIDPQYLSMISKNTTRNLDPWIMGEKAVNETFVQNSQSDISVIEGVMGFYDGSSGNSDYSSTHHIASMLKAPVILILDASKTARSIAAVAHGYKTFDKNSRISGVILNKVASSKHSTLCKTALQKLKIPIIGIIPKQLDLELKSRHLGLVNTSQEKLYPKIDAIATRLADYIDVDLLIKIAKKTSPLKPIPKQKVQPKKNIVICVALDDSFNFYYADNLSALQRNGARLEFFSPISDVKIPKCDGLYIGGGYPEILGNPLAKNLSMRRLIKKLAQDNIPIYAECGGLMYLTRKIIFDKKKYNMVGLYDLETEMKNTLKLNYTKGTIVHNCSIAKPNHRFHGHEFHYSEIQSTPHDARFAYNLELGHGITDNKDGIVLYNTLASYGHLYFDRSNFAREFVNTCRIYSRH